MKAYYGSRFSPNMTRTPENYLICHNVPIARTGEYEYLGQELGVDEYYDKVIKVYRSPAEVFSNASIASFEGKPVTDEHPPIDVKPDNYNSYLRGITTNVRRGTDEYEDCLVADLVIYDPLLISEIESGKREVSCGYDCTYEELEDGKYQQRQICGNHVAIVVNGRAGSRIAIKDSKKENLKNKTERSMAMGKSKENVLAKMLKAFARDAEPEEIAQAMDELSGLKEEPTASVETTDEDNGMSDIMERLSNIETVLARLVKTDEEVHSDVGTQDALEELEEELENSDDKTDESSATITDADGEESVTIPAEEITTDEDGTEEEEKSVTTDSKAAIRNTLRAMKPVIASIKNPVERQRASDALAKSLRGQMKDADKTYAKIDNTVKSVMQKTADAKAEDNLKLGAEIAKKFNPHYNKGVK